MNKFIDEAVINVTSGKGGDGVVHMHREKYEPKGGPDGGDGGKGGDVVIIGNSNLATLRDFKYIRRFKAEDGGNGSGNNKHGKNGKSMYIEVPTGTRVYDKELNVMLFDILKHDEKRIAVYGGKGGRGNTHFKSSVKQMPLYAEDGKPGEEKVLELELMMIADVGLVGYPNAGKSTFLTAVSGAHPKIADYEFTTLIPNLGIYTDDKINITFADIPGIIEGAHQGKGLGLDFLRHISRTKFLLFIVDISKANPVDDYNHLIMEISLYNRQLLSKERLIALNKIDLVDKAIVEETLSKFSDKCYLISAKNKEGIGDIIKDIKNSLYEK